MISEFPSIKSIGKNAAEADPVLDYFLTTDAVSKIASNDAFLILGRKGSGKTALVRHFTKDKQNPYSIAFNLRGYPWALHAALGNPQGTEIEKYVATWRYLIAAQAASAVLRAGGKSVKIDADRKLLGFFEQNYGAPSVDLDKVFSVTKLKVDKATVNPTIAGVSLGSIEFKSVRADFGQQIDAVATEVVALVSEILQYRGSAHVELHFDELDFGIEKFERERELMIVGLVLAAQSFRVHNHSSEQLVRPFIYLRHDLWDTFNFSDRNKISRGPALF